MGRLRAIQSNFTAGEWSPRLASRADLAKYWNSLETLENFILYPQGGVTRRPGTHYVATQKITNKKVRLIPFKFSTAQAYVVEMGHLYARFYMNHGQIQGPDANTNLLLHGDGVDASTVFSDSGVTGHTLHGHGNVKISTDQYFFGYSSIYFDGDGDFLHIPDHTGFDFSGGSWTFDARVYTQPKYIKTIYYQDAGTDQDYIRLWIEGGTAPLYNGTLRFEIKAAGAIVAFLQSSAPIYNSEWNHVAVVENGNSYFLFINGYRKAADVFSGIRPANYTSDVSIGSGYAGSNYFKGYMDEIRVSKGSARWTGVWFAPPSVQYPLSGSETPVEIVTPYREQDLPGLKFVQSADTMWITHPLYKPRKLTRASHVSWALTEESFTSIPAWDDSRGWPGTVFFHENRLVYGGTATYPSTIFASNSADFPNFTTGTADADAFIYNVSASDIIRWVCSHPSALIAGTAESEFKMTSGSESFLSPTNAVARPATTHGCLDAMPIKIGGVILFWQKCGRKLRELVYDFNADSWVAPDLTLLAEHITEGGISYSDYQQEPNSILWNVRRDGVIPTMTYMRDQDVVGWARQITAGSFESVAVIPNPGDTANEVWVSVKRTINGADTRYIEYFDPELLVDCGITYSGVPVTSVTGADHLEGEAVDIVGDGAVLTPGTVTSGAVSLSRASSEVQVGLNYVSTLKTQRPTVQASAGTIAGLPKKWAEAYVFFLESSGAKINGEAFSFLAVGATLGDPITPFTGSKSVSQLGWDDGQITVTQDLPLPCTILSIFGTLEHGE